MNEEKLEVKEEDVSLTKEDEKKVLNAIKQAHLDATKLTPEAQAALKDMMDKAKLPIEYNDKDFKMGDQELDVRHLNRANYRQVEFRLMSTMMSYVRSINMSLVDILRMLMVLADKLGVEDIVKATDDVLEKIENKEEEKKLAKDKNLN